MSAFNFLDELLDNTIHALDLRAYWQIYAAVAIGFLVVFTLPYFLTKESVSVIGILGIIAASGIIGGIWHASSDDR